MNQNSRQKLRQLLYRARRDYFTRDNIILASCIFLFVLFTYSGISVIDRNWRLSAELETKKTELMKTKIEIETLEYEQKYLASEEYQELSAREKQNKMLPGESVLVLPKNSKSALEKYASPTLASTETQNNFQSWLNYLFP
jgi:cell division protein FtsB